MGNSSIIMYTTEDGLTKIETTFDEDTVWLSLEQMAELFQRDKSTISRHIKNIFEEGELQRNSVVANFATTASDGTTYHVDYYNLDVIISVGYRVKSHRGTQFRIWAMGILKEYMKKGFALDDDRLKRLGGGNYFDELLARIRDIRSSDKVFWRKVLEIYATSIDYDPHAESSVLQTGSKHKEPMYMKDWLETIDDYLKMTRRDILTSSGHISHKQAIEKAHAEYDKYKNRLDDTLSPVERILLKVLVC